MAEGRMEAAGELVAHLIECIPVAVWAPGELVKPGVELNPFSDRPAMSEAMRKHLAEWERVKWRGMVEGARDAG